jgi:ferredoxin
MPEAARAWTVVVDRDVCMGSGMCIVYAPSSFVHDDETKAVFLEPPGDELDTVRIAVEACPTGALRLVTDEDKETS